MEAYILKTMGVLKQNNKKHVFMFLLIQVNKRGLKERTEKKRLLYLFYNFKTSWRVNKN